MDRLHDIGNLDRVVPTPRRLAEGQGEMSGIFVGTEDLVDSEGNYRMLHCRRKGHGIWHEQGRDIPRRCAMCDAERKAYDRHWEKMERGWQAEEDLVLTLRIMWGLIWQTGLYAAASWIIISILRATS